MKKDTFLKILYVCLAVIVIVFTISFVYYSIESKIDHVFADTLENNAILNFNQLNQNGNFSSNTNWRIFNTNNYNLSISNNSAKVIVNSVNSDSNLYSCLISSTNTNVFTHNHKIFIHSVIDTNIVSNIRLDFHTGTTLGQTQIGKNEYDYIYTLPNVIDSNYFYGVVLNNQAIGSYYELSNYFIVDLTQMFGVGNEPQTIEEAKTYFPLDYYSYNLGSPISVSQLNFENGYNLGYKNGLDIGYKYTNSEIVFKNQINNFEDLNTHKKVNAIINEDNTITYYSNVIGTGYLIPKNKQVIITWEYISAGVTMSLDNGEGSHFELDIDNSNNANSRYIYSFSSSEDGSLNFYSDNEQTITINNLIVYIANDEQISYDNGYNDGWKDGKKSVDTQSYYDNGFIDGKNWQINHNPNSAWGSSWEFIGSAFSGVGDILSIELLPNIPLWTFIAIPLLFGLIALLYKLIGG